ncbi:hypothetical protein BH10ACI2_BH10ACI2_00550 [soil metagenome]
MIRNILGVIVGYLIFAVSAVMLFNLSGIDPHADASGGTIALVIVFGAVFAFIGGYLAKMIASTKTMTVNYALAVLMVCFAAFSLLKSPGNHYTQIAAIFLFAPMSLFGGFQRRR